MISLKVLDRKVHGHWPTHLMNLARLERELRRKEKKEYAESTEHRYLWGRRKKDGRNPFSDELRVVFNIYFYKKNKESRHSLIHTPALNAPITAEG